MSVTKITTNVMREWYVRADHSGTGSRDEYERDFDRWLEAHDAEVRAGVVAEEPEWEYARRADRTGYTTDGIYSAEEVTDGLMPGWTAVRRRKAGPWVPVKQGDDDER